MKWLEELVGLAEEAEQQIYPNGNGKRTRRVAILAVLLTIILGWQYFTNERVVTAVKDLKAGQDSLGQQVAFSIEWIKYHQLWSERAMKDTNADRKKVWRALNRIEDYEPFDEKP